jgi:hypothetical protein
MQFAMLTAIRHQIVTLDNNYVGEKIIINGRRQSLDGRYLQSLLKRHQLSGQNSH